MNLSNLQYSFDYLEQHKHQTPKSPRNNFWNFSDLYNLLGAPCMGHAQNLRATMLGAVNFKSFDIALKHSPSAPKDTNFWNFFEDHVQISDATYTIYGKFNHPTQRTRPDAKLSRYACWSLMNQFPTMIFFQLYFLMPGSDFPEIYRQKYKMSRIYLRNDLQKYKKHAINIAISKNVDPSELDQIINKTFFADAPNEINHNTAPVLYTPDSLINYMGPRSLAALKSALRRATSEYANNPETDFSKFEQILEYELTSRREHMIANLNKTPAQDITQLHINKIYAEFKKLKTAFIEQYAFQKLR